MFSSFEVTSSYIRSTCLFHLVLFDRVESRLVAQLSLPAAVCAFRVVRCASCLTYSRGVSVVVVFAFQVVGPWI